MNHLSKASVLAALVVATLSLAWVSAALAAAPSVGGVSVQTATSVKVVFTQPVAASAAATSHYSVSPSLSIVAASIADGGRSVLLTTAPQLNAVSYTVAVSGVTGTDGSALVAPTGGSFIGTTVTAPGLTSGTDDFNRPSGLITTATPIPGPWLGTDIDSANTLSLTTSSFAGTGAISSHVADIDPEKDNAFVYNKITGRDYYLSAYIFIPSGQGWGSQQEIGLMRTMQSMYTSQARVSAVDQASAQFYSLNVNWKSTGNKYIGPQIVATNVPFDSWHWIEMHVKDATSTTQGEIQVWLDGRLDYQQNTMYVYPAGMTYCQFGIMHLVTLGPAATTITDEVRYGNTFQLPSTIFDTTPPTVSLTSPANGSTLPATVTLAANAGDGVQVQRVDFLVDGAVVGSDDFAPYSVAYATANLTAGAHTFTAVAYDTSGDSATSTTVTGTIGGLPPDFLTMSVSPRIFSPNGDGSLDTAGVTYTLLGPATVGIRVETTDGQVVRVLLPPTSESAGSHAGPAWDGGDQSASTVADGPYVIRATATTTAGSLDVTGPVTVDTRPAAVTLGAIVPDPYNGVGPLTIPVTVDEPGTATVTLSTAAPRRHAKAPTITIATTAVPAGTTNVAWNGLWGGKPAAGGGYTVRVYFTDQAGNAGAPSPAIGVFTLAP